MITISNDGQKIVSTNYWDTEHAKRGFLYLSWNAGAGRLLLPDTNQGGGFDVVVWTQEGEKLPAGQMPSRL